MAVLGVCCTGATGETGATGAVGPAGAAAFFLREYPSQTLYPKEPQ